MNWLEKQHRVWELRHNACKKCHGDSSEPCICGPEPCKRCVNGANSDITATGCVSCDKRYATKTIDTEGCLYTIHVRCPYCDKFQGVEGHDGGRHPLADILKCYSCGEQAWLGCDTHGNFDDINDVDAVVEDGEP